MIGQSSADDLRNPPREVKARDNSKSLDYSYSEDKNEDTLLADEPVIDGNVKVDFVNGRFEGEIRSGRRNGFGRYFWKDGSMYEVGSTDDRAIGKTITSTERVSSDGRMETSTQATT